MKFSSTAPRPPPPPLFFRGDDDQKFPTFFSVVALIGFWSGEEGKGMWKSGSTIFMGNRIACLTRMLSDFLFTFGMLDRRLFFFPLLPFFDFSKFPYRFPVIPPKLFNFPILCIKMDQPIGYVWSPPLFFWSPPALKNAQLSTAIPHIF